MTGAGPTSLRALFRGLSARLLLLTAAFVLASEALLLLPVLAHRRHDLLQEKARVAELVVLAAEGTLQPQTQDQLRRLGEYISLRVTDAKGGTIALMPPVEQVVAEAEADLRRPFWTMPNLQETARLVMQDRPRPVHLIHPATEGSTVEAVIGQQGIARDLREFARTMAVVGLVVSAITGILVFLAIHRLMVRPVRRLTSAIGAFRDAPESPSPPDPGIGRGDEIGVAAREFAHMRQELRGAMWQQSRLAALGAAVAKISHDLKSILATALLVADRLERSPDPNVRRAAPMLVDAIGRAAELARSTVDFAREGRPALDRVPLTLAGLVDEAIGTAGLRAANVHQIFPPELGVLADRIQLGRALTNLLRNAFEAGARQMTIRAVREEAATVITLADDGPGLPASVRAKLFQPFGVSTRRGGAGLGLAIARDALRAHGGDVVLERTGADGTVFRLVLPDQQAELPEPLAPPAEAPLSPAPLSPPPLNPPPLNPSPLAPPPLTPPRPAPGAELVAR